MQISGFIYIMGVFLFLALEGFFSSLETAFICTDLLKIKRLKKTKPKAYIYLTRFLSHPEHFLATTLVGTNLSVISASCCATTFLLHAGVENPSWWVSVLLTPVVLLFAEMLPKSIGRVFQLRFIIYFLAPFKFLEIVLRPLVSLVEFIPLKVIRLFSKGKDNTLNKDDIKILTETLHSEGKIKRRQKEAIVDVLGFSRTRVKDIYVPLKKVAGVDYIDSLEDIIAVARARGFTRYPVFKNTKVVGYLSIFDLFYKKFDSWHELIRSITRVSINQRLDDVMSHFLGRKKNIALVLKGERPYGIITTQDLMEEVTDTLIKKYP